MVNEDQNTSYWHLDRRVPVAIIVAIFLQTSGAVWWAATTAERVAQNERFNGLLDLRMQRVERIVAEQASQDAVLVEQISNTNQSIRVLREEVRSTNQLLRELLNTMAERTER